MAALDLHHGRKPHELAADLRRAFSGIVAGNVKEDGMRRIEEHGPFQIHGDTDMMESLDALLRAFVEQRRMKISGDSSEEHTSELQSLMCISYAVFCLTK